MSPVTLPTREAVVMAKNLPNRPKRVASEAATKVRATDRVKSKADKVDPRFEAARQRLAREEQRRAKADAARKAREQAEAEAAARAGSEPEPETSQDTGPRSPGTGFSFNRRDAS